MADRVLVASSGASRRTVYRQTKRLLLGLVARRWTGSRLGLEPAVRRYLRGRSRGYLLRLSRDGGVAMAAAAAVLATATAGALPPVNPSDISAGDGGFVMNGVDPGDEAGFSVSGAGDVNGDGLADVIVGAPVADPGGNFAAGESYSIADILIFPWAARHNWQEIDLADFPALEAWYRKLEARPAVVRGMAVPA